MQRVLFKMRCMNGKRDEYIRRHTLLMNWKNTKEGIGEAERKLLKDTSELHRAAGIRNYSIFIAGNELFAYFEAEDYKASLDRVTKSPAGQAWQKYMEGLLEQEDGAPVMQILDSPVFILE